MPPKKVQTERDRFLVLRGETYHYKRRVPSEIADIDGRAPHVRMSLKTSDLARARAARDALAAADDAYWAELLADEDGEAAKLRHRAAVRRAEAIGFGYVPAAQLTAAPVETIIKRLEAVMDERTPQAVSRAVLGMVPVPRVTLTQALKTFTEEISKVDLAQRNALQRRTWTKIFARAVNNFTDLNGDMAIDDIGREHALKVFDFWTKRITDGIGGTYRSPNSGNRDLSSLRRLYRDYYRHIGQRDRPNPFDDLSFVERGVKVRPPYPTEWIKTKLLAPGAFAELNAEATAIVLLMIETGLRPSEAANLDAGSIVLDADVPHVSVAPRPDPDDPRLVKTEAAIRLVPLVGVALAVMKAFPTGFARYRNRDYALSATVNKHLKTHKLNPTPKHTLYSLRHAFEDRMKDAGIDTELRMILMGHRIDRAQYGSGGSLTWRKENLEKIALPFEARVVPQAGAR